MAMNHDHLLLWLSSRGEGSWSQFRGAVEALHVDQEEDMAGSATEEERSEMAAVELPLYQRLRFDLQRLAHVEFITASERLRWRIVPPTLALLPHDPHQGVICGARTPEVLARLAQGDVDVATTESSGMPQRIMLRGSPDVLASQAIQMGFRVQVDAATTLLAAAPLVRDKATWSKTSIPDTPDWTVHHFSPLDLRWVEATVARAAAARTGLFRFAMNYQRLYYLRWRGDSYHVPVQVGKYVVMAKSRRRLLEYDREARALWVPVAFRPPLLIERALILCSGLLPEFDRTTGRLQYGAIPPNAVRLAAQLLQQEV